MPGILFTAFSRWIHSLIHTLDSLPGYARWILSLILLLILVLDSLTGSPCRTRSQDRLLYSLAGISH